MDKLNELKAKCDDLEQSLKAFKELPEADVTADQITEAEANAEALKTARAELKDLTIQAKEEANNRISGLLNAQNAGPSQQPSSGPAPRIVVPASARSRRELKAFDSEEDAYCAGRWFAANLFNHARSQQWMKDNQVFNTAFSENDDQKGGLFVPHEISTNIVRLVEQFGVARSECRVEPMASNTKTVPVRTAGLTAYAVGESDQNSQPTGTASSADYKPCELVARKWKVRTRVSDELNEDSLIEIAEQVALESAQAFAEAEDDALFNGDGGNSYHGIKGLKNTLGAAGIFTMGAGDGSFADVTLADLDSVMALCPHYPGIMPKWYVSKYGYFAMMGRLMNAAGGNTNQTLASGVAPNYQGYPVVFSEKLFGAAGDTSADEIIAFFGDLSMGVIFGDRRDMTLSIDTSVAWEEDQIAIKATERMDIKVHSPGDASNPGPVVALKTDIA